MEGLMARVSLLTADAARGATNLATVPTNTNTDGDHFFCLPKTSGASTNLLSIFKSVGTVLAGGSRLVALP
jgi:hypothetical protein